MAVATQAVLGLVKALPFSLSFLFFGKVVFSLFIILENISIYFFCDFFCDCWHEVGIYVSAFDWLTCGFSKPSGNIPCSCGSSLEKRLWHSAFYLRPFNRILCHLKKNIRIIIWLITKSVLGFLLVLQKAHLVFNFYILHPWALRICTLAPLSILLVFQRIHELKIDAQKGSVTAPS